MATAQQEPGSTGVTTAVESVRATVAPAGIVLPSVGAVAASPSPSLIVLAGSATSPSG
jgi:hypothetical protein